MEQEDLVIEKLQNLDNIHGVLIDIDYRHIKNKTDEIAELIFYIRTSEGKRLRIFYSSYNPFIYVKADSEQISKLLAEDAYFKDWFLKSEEITKKKYNGGKQIDLTKISGKQPWKVPKLREILDNNQIKYYEADIPFTHRFLIDNDLYGLTGITIRENMGSHIFEKSSQEINPLILSIDIEIDSSIDSDERHESISSMLIEVNRRITAISYWWGEIEEDKNKKIFVLEDPTDEGEANFIKKALDFLWNKIDPDIIVSYNGDEFDFPYLTKRMQKLGLPLNLLSPYSDQQPIEPSYGRGWTIPGLMVFDLYHRTRWIYTNDGKKSLNSVSKELLKESKIEIPFDHGEIWHQALKKKEYMKLFKKYSLKDVELTYKLWFAMNMMEWLEIIKITGPPPREAMYFTERQSGEFLVYRMMYKNGILIPPVPSAEVKKLRKRDRISAKGGLVFDPIRDLTTSVLICDFTSMYPSIMTSHNVGAESFLGIKNDPLDRFAENPRTSMATMQDYMLAQRVKVKELLTKEKDSNEIKRLTKFNQALKIVANSTFGSYNFIGSRFYNTDIAGTITEIGRNYLMEISKQVKQYKKGYETIYGDTDSVFIETPLDKEIEDLWKLSAEESLNYKNNVSEVIELMQYLKRILPPKMRLELQDIAYRILFHKGAKKRYTYISAITKKVTIIGLEAVRHDWSQFSKDIQKQAIDVILRTGDLKLAKTEIINFIKKKIRSNKEELKESLTTFGPIKRDPGKYKSRTPAIAAFEDYIKRTKQDSSKVWKYYDYFPYIIVAGHGPIRDRAFHPDFVKVEEIDIDHYISKSLATIKRFNVDIELNEVKGYIYSDLKEFFDVDLISGKM